MSNHYDRDLNPIPNPTTNKTEFEGRRVLRTREGEYDISTVWLDSDYRHQGDRPVVFETAIFIGEIQEGQSEVAGERHYTEEEAARHHLACLDAIREGHHPSYDSDWMTKPPPTIADHFEAAWHAVQGDTYADRIYRMGLEAAAQQDPQLLTRLNTLKETP